MPVLGSPATSAASLGVSVKNYGAKGDGISRADAVTTNGSAVVTSATGTFTAADVGKFFRVYNGGTVHTTTIASRQSATQVTLAVVVPFTGTGRYYTYGTDDTTAITTAIAALGTAAVDYSKTLYFPASSGTYLDTTTRSFDRTNNVTILGDNSKGFAQYGVYTGSKPVSPWVYTGDAGTSFISARGTTGFSMKNMCLLTEGQAFAGVLLDLSAFTAGVGDITWAARVETCTFADARTNQNIATALDVRGVVLGTFTGCNFERLGKHVVTTNGSALFSNVITFRDCTFDLAYTNAVYLPYSTGCIPKGWLFDACTFEQPSGAGAPAPILVDQCETFQLVNTGFWDNCPGSNGGIQQASASGTLHGLSVIGSHMEITTGGFAFALKTVNGLSVQGCDFSLLGTVFKTGMTATNFMYQGNSHNGTTNNSGVVGGSLTT